MRRRGTRETCVWAYPLDQNPQSLNLRVTARARGRIEPGEVGASLGALPRSRAATLAGVVNEGPGAARADCERSEGHGREAMHPWNTTAGSYDREPAGARRDV